MKLTHDECRALGCTVVGDIVYSPGTSAAFIRADQAARAQGFCISEGSRPYLLYRIEPEGKLSLYAESGTLRGIAFVLAHLDDEPEPPNPWEGWHRCESDEGCYFRLPPDVRYCDRHASDEPEE